MQETLIKTRTVFPYKIKTISHIRIPLSDGISLSARIWLPVDAEKRPVPAVLEYIPYRLNDLTSKRDSMNHAYFAGFGYASIRVDIRGSGDSEGVLRGEYLEQELIDGEEVIRWIAKQPWCTGKVGMIGISWGGFNGLQLAARDIEELSAVITLCSTDDRYTDDVHYMGGCLLTDNISWASTMFAYNSCPPDPQQVGDKWRSMWTERLRESGLWLQHWLTHQKRDDFWKHGSICEDFSAVRCPVFAVSGWADGYSNAVFRLLKNLKVPRKGLIGPWGHKYPHIGYPGPAIGFLQEAVRWWDAWLKGIDNGVENGPMLTVWMQDNIQPTAGSGKRPGRWVVEQQWPSNNVIFQNYYLVPGQLIPFPQNAENKHDIQKINQTGTPAYNRQQECIETIQSPLSVGLFAGKWCSYSSSTDLPSDQREEDGGALVYETSPLIKDFEILGAPELEIEISSNKAQAMLAARLSDVAPDDKVTRVSYGILNVSHRNSHEKPKRLIPNTPTTIKIRLNEIAQTFRQGHKIRLSISTSYWPLAWPAPEPFKLTIYLNNSRLTLPQRKRYGSGDTVQKISVLRPFNGSSITALTPKPTAFLPPEGAAHTPITLLEPENRKWEVCHDLATNTSSLNVKNDQGRFRLEDSGLEVKRERNECYSYTNYSYDTVRAEVSTFREFKRGVWHVKSINRTILTSDKNNFYLRADLDAYEGDIRIFSKSWDETIPRDMV